MGMSVPQSVLMVCGVKAVTVHVIVRINRFVTGPQGPVCVTAKMVGWVTNVISVRYILQC